MAKKSEPTYVPPFTVSAEAINLIAEISGQIERYAIRMEQSDGLLLRKANRIKTIHSSLAIEGNTLSEDEVRDIIDGKTVVAPIRQIQEVKTPLKHTKCIRHWTHSAKKTFESPRRDDAGIS